MTGSTPERSARSRNAVRTLLFALAVAGLAGCGGDGDGEPTAPREPAPAAAAPDLRFEPAALTLAPGDSAQTTVRVEPAADLRGATFTLDGAPPGLSTRFAAAPDGASGTLTVAASADAGAVAESLLVKGRKADGSKTWLGWLTLNVSSTATTYFVDPVSGSNANSGTQDKPLKTLGKALSVARSGDTVKLAGGGYGPAAASGEQFPAGGLIVPSGVTIEGALDSGFPVSTLVGTGQGVGLNFAGDAMVRNLTIGGSGFGVGLYAKQGTQTLSNILLGVAGSSAVVDGATLSGGIVLRGTAQATLLAGASGANTTGSTIFLSAIAGAGVAVIEQARFTMDGGEFTAGAVNCRTNVRGVLLRDAAQATLKNIVAFRNIAGAALDMIGTSKATLSQSLIFRDNPAGCAPAPSVALGESASLTMDNAGMVQNGNHNQGIGIFTNSDAPLTRVGKSISGYVTGIKAAGTGKLALDGVSIATCDLCIDAGAAQGNITITNSELHPGLRLGSVGIITRALKMRGSKVSGTGYGIVVTGPGVDLGTVNDLGNNTFANNAITGVTFNTASASISTLNAVGNTWNANTQNADASGHYPQRLLVTQESSLARGTNFKLLTLGNTFPNFQIQL